MSADRNPSAFEIICVVDSNVTLIEAEGLAKTGEAISPRLIF
jgi:hypothetical protein